MRVAWGSLDHEHCKQYTLATFWVWPGGGLTSRFRNRSQTGSNGRRFTGIMKLSRKEGNLGAKIWTLKHDN